VPPSAAKHGTIWKMTGPEPSGGMAAGGGIGRLQTVVGFVAGDAAVGC